MLGDISYTFFKMQMDACEKIVRDLLHHEDSWPFTEAVNLREVGC